MKMRKRTTVYIISVVMILLSILSLFVIKYNVLAIKKEVDAVNRELGYYQKQLNIMEAEWAYLTSPVRIERLTNKYLSENKVIAASQLKDLEQLKPLYLAKLNQQKPILALGF